MGKREKEEKDKSRKKEKREKQKKKRKKIKKKLKNCCSLHAYFIYPPYGYAPIVCTSTISSPTVFTFHLTFKSTRRRYTAQLGLGFSPTHPVLSLSMHLLPLRDTVAMTAWKIFPFFSS